MYLRPQNHALLAIGALALGAAVAGCSSSANPVGFGADDAGGYVVPNGDGAAAQSDGGGVASSGGGSSGAGTGSSSGSGGNSGGSGTSGSGSSGSDTSEAGAGADAGSQGVPEAGGDRQDATTLPDASASADTGGTPEAGGNPGSDAGLCADQAVWLTPMNQARASLGVGEPPLVCDPIAVQVALNYANKCMYAHNPNRSPEYVALGGTGGLGENIAAGAPTESIMNAVTSWLNEAPDYNHATNSCAAGKACGHYTQIVWKKTTGVGCAHVSCTKNSPFGGGFAKWDFSVCDYSPPGNYVGQPPY